MPYDPQRHRRRSIRWHGYDYAQPGSFFVTICVQHRTCLFGEVVNGDVRLNDAGRTVEWWWAELPARLPDIETDAFVVMPNHIHGIVTILPNDPSDNAAFEANGPGEDGGRHPGLPLRSASVGAGPGARPPVALPDIVHWFKTKTTDDYIRGVKQERWPPFPGRLWQRNYYDRVIRDDRELERIRHYISENPMHWSTDPENPSEAPQ